MKLHTKLATGFTLLGGVMAVGSAWAGCPAPIPLPAPGNPSTSVQFGDAVVYALPLLVDQGVIPTGVQSSPGQISDCIVVGTGAGAAQDNNLLGLADNAYDNKQGDQNPYFRTGDTTLPNNTDPGGANQFTGDTANTWDIKLSALTTFLQGGQLTFLFNHNQTGTQNDTSQDLFIWAQVALVDTNPADGTTATKYFYVTAVNNTTGLTNFGLPGGDPTTYVGPQTAATSLYPSLAAGAGTFPTGGECSANGGADGLPLCSSGTGADFFVRARGRVCLNAADVPVDCADPTATHFINDNLGANEVANAAVFPEIDAILALAGFGGFDTMQIDWRMGCNASVIPGGVCPTGSVLNNGYEQLFIIGGPEIPTVPEPATVALLGAAVLGLFAAGRRRKR